MDLVPLLKYDSQFVLFLAPPGWGKTTMLLSMYQKHLVHLVFVSPLRALANEFYERVKPLGRVYLIEKKVELKEITQKFFSKKSGLLVVTPETLNQEFLSIAEEQIQKPIFVLDEFHLFYYWGESFRPTLWESCLGIANSGASILGLTATIESSLLERWKKDFLIGMEGRFLIDLGNRRLKSLPTKSLNYFYLGEKIFNRHFIWHLKRNTDKTYLYFCRYRSQVDSWLRYCKREGILAIGCKGGEIPAFLESLKENPKPICIFSTTALSHGVNLPEISKVFINHFVESHDFWLQMIGRGGRQGGPYQTYSFGDNETSLRERVLGLKSLLLNYL